MKTFKPANENVPRLKEYGTDLGDAYWDKWVCNSYKKEQGSFIDHDELRVLAEEMDHPEKEKVEAIAVMLQYGADIGVQGEGRWPSSWNAVSLLGEPIVQSTISQPHCSKAWQNSSQDWTLVSTLCSWLIIVAVIRKGQGHSGATGRSIGVWRVGLGSDWPVKITPVRRSRQAVWGRSWGWCTTQSCGPGT